MNDLAQPPVFDCIQDLYQFLDLPTDQIDANSDFAIHFLTDVHTELPYQSPVFRANYFSFVFAKNALGSYTTGAQSFQTTPGTIYFTNPGHYKSFSWQQVSDVCLITLSEAFLKENVHADILEEFPFLLAETVPPQVLAPDAFAEFDQLCRQIQHEYARPSAYRDRVIGSLIRVILLKIKALSWQKYNPIEEGSRSSQIVKTFRQMLEGNFRQLSRGETTLALRVQDYADAQSLHPNYFSNVITSKTGKSVSGWIAEKTIAEAKALLQHSSLSIKEIAYRLAFTESTHFSTYFKKHTHLSPVSYRKQHTGAANQAVT